MHLAQGWPAVLALAAVSDAALPGLTAAPHLYGFFADEIYRRIDQRVRRVLCRISSLRHGWSPSCSESDQPDVAERVVTVGVDNGFLTEVHDKRLDMHPLLRAFLQRKFEADRSRVDSQIVERAAGVLIEHRLWDETFQLMQRFKQEQLIPVLVAASMDELLASGRCNDCALDRACS